MKTLKSILICTLALLSITASAASKKIYNKYGMLLKVAQDSSVSIISASKYMKVSGIDVYSLEDALIPYKNPKSKVICKNYKTVRSEDYAYKTLEDGSQLMISVDFAENVDAPAPVLFVFHGGSWQRGSRSSMSSLTKTLAKEHGVTCVRVQYSFLSAETGVTFDQVLADCKDAVRYIAEHASELNVDPDRIGFMGQSSGGHLAAAMAVTFPQTKLLMGNYGPYDLQYSSQYKRESYSKKQQSSKTFVNFRYGLHDFDPQYMQSVSPYFMAKAPLKFKAVLFQGSGDITVYPSQAERFADKLRQCGADVEMVVFPYATHSLSASMYRDEWYAKIIDFASKDL